MTRRKQYRGKTDKPEVNNGLTYFDLKFGMKFRASGEGGKIYKIVGLESKKTYSIVTLKREADGLVLTYRADRFLSIINQSTLLSKQKGV